MTKRCIGCNKPMPPRASSKGWELTQIACKGMGARWYRQCGCMHRRQFLQWAEDLFEAGRDYPPKAWLKYLMPPERGKP